MARKALVIDDDEDLVDVATAYLEEEGFDVASASDGKSGIEKAKSFLPDLILVDIMMPGIHGFQVCEKLRQEESLNNARILVASSKSFQNDIDSAKNAGADDYLVKPYMRADLKEKIKVLFGE